MPENTQIKNQDFENYLIEYPGQSILYKEINEAPLFSNELVLKLKELDMSSRAKVMKDITTFAGKLKEFMFHYLQFYKYKKYDFSSADFIKNNEEIRTAFSSYSNIIIDFCDFVPLYRLLSSFLSKPKTGRMFTAYFFKAVKNQLQHDEFYSRYGGRLEYYTASEKDMNYKIMRYLSKTGREYKQLNEDDDERLKDILKLKKISSVKSAIVKSYELSLPIESYEKISNKNTEDGMEQTLWPPVEDKTTTPDYIEAQKEKKEIKKIIINFIKSLPSDRKVVFTCKYTNHHFLSEVYDLNKWDNYTEIIFKYREEVIRILEEMSAEEYYRKDIINHYRRNLSGKLTDEKIAAALNLSKQTLSARYIMIKEALKQELKKYYGK